MSFDNISNRSCIEAAEIKYRVELLKIHLLNCLLNVSWKADMYHNTNGTNGNAASSILLSCATVETVGKIRRKGGRREDWIRYKQGKTEKETCRDDRGTYLSVGKNRFSFLFPALQINMRCKRSHLPYLRIFRLDVYWNGLHEVYAVNYRVYPELNPKMIFVLLDWTALWSFQMPVTEAGSRLNGCYFPCKKYSC